MEVLEALAVYALLNADAKGDHVRVRLTFAEIPLEEIPMLSERIEWAGLENLFQRDVTSLFGTELECCDLVRDSHTHHSEVQAVTLVGVNEFGIAVVIVSHAQQS